MARTSTSEAIDQRPSLPVSRLNPHLTNVPPENFVVKYQTIVREGHEIIVGRVKVPTPEGHAFILRRYDTGAFSLTTMFKACFPGALDEEEKAECDWVKNNFDNSGANGGKTTNTIRLAGSWVVLEIAQQVAKDYGIISLIEALSEANPDPQQQYRKSQRSQAASEELNASRVSGSTSSQHSTGSTPAAKRTRTSEVKSSQSPSQAERSPLRSSTRAAAASSLSSTPLKSAEVKQSDSQIIVEVDAKKVDEVIDAEQRRIAAEKELMESKRLVEELKAKELEKKAALQAAAEAAAAEKQAQEGQVGSEDEEMKGEDQEEQVEQTKSGKRTIEEVESEETSIDEKREEEEELEEGRRIATNSRALVPPPPGGAMQTFKQAAWGALVFGVGVGATLVPLICVIFLSSLFLLPLSISPPAVFVRRFFLPELPRIRFEKKHDHKRGKDDVLSPLLIVFDASNARRSCPFLPALQNYFIPSSPSSYHLSIPWNFKATVRSSRS